MGERPYLQFGQPKWVGNLSGFSEHLRSNVKPYPKRWNSWFSLYFCHDIRDFGQSKWVGNLSGFLGGSKMTQVGNLSGLLLYRFVMFCHEFHWFSWFFVEKNLEIFAKIRKKMIFICKISYKLQNDGSRRLLGVMSWDWNWTRISDECFVFL